MQNVSEQWVNMDSQTHSFHSFVMAVRKDAANNRGPVFLRSYLPNYTVMEIDEIAALLPDIKVWEAGRATSAAPAYFKAFSVGKYELVDGGLGANNPLGW